MDLGRQMEDARRMHGAIVMGEAAGSCLDLVRERVGWMGAWDAGAAACGECGLLAGLEMVAVWIMAGVEMGSLLPALEVLDGRCSPSMGCCRRQGGRRGTLLMGRSWLSSSSLPADGSRASLDRDGAGWMRCRWWPVCCRRTACGADGGWQSSCGGAWPLDHGERKWGLLIGLIGEDDGAPYWCSVLWRSTANCVPAMYKFAI
ncbi:hypothetical protein ACLOJK_022846 [Asimina triloba]